MAKAGKALSSLIARWLSDDTALLRFGRGALMGLTIYKSTGSWEDAVIAGFAMTLGAGEKNAVPTSTKKQGGDEGA